MCELSAMLKPLTVVDSHGEAGNYEILTIYYDTPGLDFFYDKIHGFFSKTKVRIRFYRNQSNQNWHDPHIEIKQRNGNLVNKQKAALPAETHISACLKWQPAEFRDKLIQTLNDAETAGALAGKALAPTVMVFYKRRAMQFDGIEGLRFTFDSQIAGLRPATEFFAPEFKFADHSNCNSSNIFEIKAYAEPPASILNQLEIRNIHQQSHSKYSTCLQRLLERSNDARLII